MLNFLLVLTIMIGINAMVYLIRYTYLRRELDEVCTLTPSNCGETKNGDSNG